eukprot:3479958-Pleurochrysis_carterae.AAC.2
MMSGKREHLVMMAAFSEESGSAGRPCVRHSATTEGSVSSCIGWKSGVSGMERLITSGVQFSPIKRLRKSELKGAM